jgi:hypothetical protein
MTNTEQQAAVREYLADLGRKGGAAKSEAKTAAARLNAQRPRKRTSIKVIDTELNNGVILSRVAKKPVKAALRSSRPVNEPMTRAKEQQ